jgi:hypothetical protein
LEWKVTQKNGKKEKDETGNGIKEIEARIEGDRGTEGRR